MDELDIPDEVEAALRRQDEAMALLGRLRADEPYKKPKTDIQTGRREFRRWPIPESVSVEFHDGRKWHPAAVIDLGVGGAQLSRFPDWTLGPVPVRLRTPSSPSVLALADVMWKDAGSPRAGVRFEFLDPEEREVWADGLIDALLARHAL